MDEKVIVLDFGGQYSQLIARRIREAGVYCEILSYDSDLSKLQDTSIKGFIFTGGPHSVYLPASPSCTHKIFDLNRPILGICYGMQVIAHILGGTVEAAEKAEFGRVSISIKEDSSIFSGCCESFDVWMSHNDQVTAPPTGFKVIASSANCAVAAIENSEKKIYGVQFHPEVTHSMYGTKIIENFLYNVCGCSKLWRAENLADTLIEQIKAQAGTQKVIAALSGGVDSSVASVLVHKAIGNNLTCIFVNHGLLRKNEAEEVLTAYKENLGLNIVYVDASARFLNRLKGITNPEEKRKIIGREFIRVFEEEAKKIGGADFLVQGTIYPDVAESGGQKKAAVKSHHNVGGLPENMEFKGLIEPLRQLFKDEVRALGEKLGIPHKLVWRQPFPGPGLAVRILGEITEDKLRLVRESDAILREEITKAGLEESIWQYFTVFPDVRTVGVMGDGRTYDNLIAVRAVTSSDAMTVETAEIPFYILQKISLRIINEVKGINRVVYDITPKPPATIEWE